MKGQAAMEYLMTYGWALLVIVIVIAILLWLVPLSASEQCTFSTAGLSCNQPANPVLGKDGKLYGKLTNGLSTSINVTAMACTASTGNVNKSDSVVASGFTANNTASPQGSVEISALSSAGKLVRCYKIDGTTTTYASGESFSGKIWVWYKYASDQSTYPDRVATATFTTKAASS